MMKFLIVLRDNVCRMVDRNSSLFHLQLPRDDVLHTLLGCQSRSPDLGPGSRDALMQVLVRSRLNLPRDSILESTQRHLYKIATHILCSPHGMIACYENPATYIMALNCLIIFGSHSCHRIRDVDLNVSSAAWQIDLRTFTGS